MLNMARRRAGLTQRELSRLTGVPQPSISRIERGVVCRVRGCYRPRDRADHAYRSACRVTEVPTFDPVGALKVLVEHEVHFVVIGGYAAGLQGSPVVTFDLDICYARDEGNLERLASALRALGARLRGPDVPEDLPFEPDERALALGDTFTFATLAGPLDVLATPSATRGFADLDADAQTMDVGGFTVRAASVDDLIRMKAASGRPKDQFGLIHLRALRRRLEGGES